jgi:hypothetical protein
VASTSESSVDFQWTTDRYIQQDRTLHDNESLGSIKDVEFLEQCSDYQLLKLSATSVFFFHFQWVETESHGTAAATSPLYQLQMIDDGDYRAVGRM